MVKQIRSPHDILEEDEMMMFSSPGNLYVIDEVNKCVVFDGNVYLNIQKMFGREKYRIVARDSTTFQARANHFIETDMILVYAGFHGWSWCSEMDSSIAGEEDPRHLFFRIRFSTLTKGVVFEEIFSKFERKTALAKGHWTG